MKVITVGSYKGGTGKTTSVVNVAYDLSELGYRVLVIDADPQANATYMFTDVNSKNKTLSDLFLGAKIDRCIYRTKHQRLDIIKGSSEIEEVSAKPETLKNALQSVADKYDYCIIDTHPSMQLPTISAMLAADILLVPFKPDGYSKTGLAILSDYIGQIQSMYNPGLRCYVFVTQYSGRKSQTHIIFELAERYNFPVMGTVVRSREAVNTSILARKPLRQHRIYNDATKDYRDLAQEILTLL